MAKCYIVTNSVVKTWAFVILLLGILGIVLTVYYYIKNRYRTRWFETRAYDRFPVLSMAWLAGSAPGTSGTLEAPHLVAVAGAAVRQSLALWRPGWAGREDHLWLPTTDAASRTPEAGGGLTDPSLPLSLLHYLLCLGPPQHHGLRTAKLFHVAAGCCET